MIGGLGGGELVVIAILFLVVFGPGKVPQMARDLGRFITEARGAVDEFKEELTSSAEDDEPDERDRERNGGRSKASQRNGRERSDEHEEEDLGEDAERADEEKDEKGEGVYDL